LEECFALVCGVVGGTAGPCETLVVGYHTVQPRIPEDCSENLAANNAEVLPYVP